MRTTPEECAELGRRIGRKLTAATGPDGALRPAARRLDDRRRRASRSTTPTPTTALFDGLRETLDANVEVHELDADVNDPAFAARWPTGSTS